MGNEYRVPWITGLFPGSSYEGSSKEEKGASLVCPSKETWIPMTELLWTSGKSLVFGLSLLSIQWVAVEGWGDNLYR